MQEIELSAGIIEYEDTGGNGPLVVLLHGLVMDGSLWRHVVSELRADHRCIVPTFPLGGHRQPMRADADLSPQGIGKLQAEFLEVLELRDVTLVGNDSGLFLIAACERPERVARLVITSCEAFENFPPGLPGFAVALAARLPGGLNALAQPLRLRALRRLPFAFGWMAKRPILHAVTDAWLHPLLTQRAIRRDLTRYVRASKKGDLLVAAERLRSFERPTLVVWAAEDRVMPPEHGRRLADLLPHGRLIEVADSYTLIPEDQPDVLARAIRQFVRDTP
jgi:pimeloyl-ACP methyl ester carboxylesterase